MNENIMKSLGFSKEVEKKKNGICVFCDKEVSEEDFKGKSHLYKKEFEISGICPTCQDKIFK